MELVYRDVMRARPTLNGPEGWGDNLLPSDTGYGGPDWKKVFRLFENRREINSFLAMFSSTMLLELFYWLSNRQIWHLFGWSLVLAAFGLSSYSAYRMANWQPRGIEEKDGAIGYYVLGGHLLSLGAALSLAGAIAWLYKENGALDLAVIGAATAVVGGVVKHFWGQRKLDQGE